MNKNNEHDQASNNENQTINSGSDEANRENDDMHISRNEELKKEVTYEQSGVEQEKVKHEQPSEENVEQTRVNHPSHQSRNQKGHGRNRWLTPTLLGIIIGILLTTVALPIVMESGLIPSSLVDQSGNDKSTDQGTSENEDPTESNYISVDVTTQITDVVEEVSPAVVGVTNIQQQADFWQQQSENEAGTGSGVIYKKTDDDAYVITNHHVIEEADVVEVVLSDETTIKADLLGSDIFTDLAVLRMDSSEVNKVIDRGSSDNIRVGEPAIAIGNPLGHMFSGSVTQGVISGTQRTIPLDLNQDGHADWQTEVIQTDAAVNPGNSGGALINIAGKLIGINSMKINQNAVEGMAFAIPIDSAWSIIEELETDGEVTRPHMGVEIYSLEEVPKAEWSRTLDLPNDVEGGVYVWSVERLSPAEQGGLERLDVITEIDGNEILDTIDLRKVLYQDKEIGEEIEVTYYRDGEKQETTLELVIQ